MQTKKIEIKRLQSNKGQIEGLPANPRKWTNADLEKLMESMEETPMLTEARGCIVYPFGDVFVVLAGNMRAAAAKRIGWKEITCHLVPEGTDIDTLKQIVLKDNSSFGDWDTGLLLSEWKGIEFADWGIELPSYTLTEEPEAAEDDHYDVEAKLQKIKEPKTKRGEIYRLGNHFLMCGDSTDEADFEALMQNDLADLCVTDPPYNVDYEGGTDEKLKIENDRMSDGAFREFLDKAFRNIYNSTKAGAACYIFYPSWEALNFKGAYRDAGFLYKQMLIWVKNTITLSRSDYQWAHEPVIYGWKPGAAHYFIQNRKLRTVIDDQLDFDKMTKVQLCDLCKSVFDQDVTPTDVIRENKPLRNAEHPTMKPVPLVGRFIVNSSRGGGLVLDPFGGSGSTLIACEQLGRQCRMMEYDPVYCDVIIHRWETFTGQKAERIER